MLCYCSEDDSSSTLTISSLTEQLDSGARSDSQTFEDWSQTNSTLACTKLKCIVMVEQIQQIDSEIVEGVAYVCVTCIHCVMIYTIPSSDALSCKWIDCPTIHRCQSSISHAKLRYQMFNWCYC